MPLTWTEQMKKEHAVNSYLVTAQLEVQWAYSGV